MKICILSTSYPRSKSDHWVPFMHYWAKELAKTEEVTVVTSGGQGTRNFEIRDSVRIYRFNYFYPRSMQALTYTGGMGEGFRNRLMAKLQSPFFMLAFIIKSIKIAKNCDVINAHWVPSGFAALFSRALYKKPIILTEHGGSIRYLPRFINRLVLRRMDAVTSAHYDMTDAAKKMGAKNVANIKNFLDEEKFLKRHDGKSIRKELGLGNEFVVTFIGRFEPLKDPLTFIGSIPHTVRKSKKIKFIMVGDGHLRKDIDKMIAELGIGKYIIMPGPSADVDKYLAVSDLFIACSATENCFSTTILEAMLSKVPCIITKAGMTEKYFIHGKDAFLIDKQNPKQLGEAIASMLKNAKLRKKLSKNGFGFLDRYEFRNKFIRKKLMELFSSIKA